MQRLGDHLAPWNAHRENYRHIGKQREREPLEDSNRALVREEHLRDHAQRAEAKHIQRQGTTGQQANGLTHGAYVGGDVDGVGDHQQAHQRGGQPAWKHLVDIGRETFAGNPPNTRGQHLDANHERGGEQQRPDQPKPELGAGLRVGGNAAWVIIGGTGDKAGSEPANKVFCALGDHSNSPSLAHLITPAMALAGAPKMRTWGEMKTAA